MFYYNMFLLENKLFLTLRGVYLEKQCSFFFNRIEKNIFHGTELQWNNNKKVKENKENKKNKENKEKI